MCQSRMLPSSYPIKLQLTYMKYNKSFYFIFFRDLTVFSNVKNEYHTAFIGAGRPSEFSKLDRNLLSLNVY